MKYNVMLTSLYGGGPRRDVEYYFTNDGKRSMYCDAMLSAEASSKFILANYHIDEIITLGSKATFDPGDELVSMVLREGSSFYASNTEELSAYSLLRYRLAQYIEEIKIEEQDLRDLLSEEEQDEVTAFLRTFFREYLQPAGHAKYNRFFDALTQNEDLRKHMISELVNAIPAARQDTVRYITWIKNYLYDELKGTSKLELLEGNEDVKIRFVPTDGGDSLGFAYSLNESFEKLAAENDGDLELNLYICIQSEDANDTVALMNFMNIVKMIPDARVKLAKIATGTRSVDGFVNEISDETEFYGTFDLIAGSRAYMKYGKTDLMMEYWKHQNIDDDYIERLLYAMRNIDYGISLCDVADIERGINSLRRLFKKEYVPGGSVAEQYFALIIETLKRDYGVLVTGDRTEFIDLVKWTYHKGFWQQTLTFIESKAPADFAEKGIYFYANSEESKSNAVKLFAEAYNDLRSFERYKLDRVDHYFLKFYGRDRVDYAPDPDSRQRKYVKLRMDDLDEESPDVIRALTGCEDREELARLLYAYYMVGIIRNETNHAADNDANEYGLTPADSDVSERMSLIRNSVESFIYQYDKITEMMEGADVHPLKISADEVKAYANTLSPRFGGRNDRRSKAKEKENDKEKKAEADEQTTGTSN